MGKDNNQERTVTAEDLKNNPELTNQGLKVGDPYPTEQNETEEDTPAESAE